MKILLVEDCSVVQNVTRRMLNRLGHFCRSVSTGEAACSAVLEADIEVLLMDLDLPGISGLEAAQRIRELQGSQGCPWIIALTGHSAGSIEFCLGREIDDYLQKPLRLEALKSALERLEERPREAA